ncbi:MAG: hypothetical protein Q9210_002983 [Variospora velana]
MANSDGSTVPNTPELDSGEVVRLREEHVFAWLRPLNGTAHKAFDATVNTVIKHSPEFDHFRHFLHCGSRLDRSQSIFTEDEDPSHERPPVPPYQVGRNGAKAFRHPESFLLEPGEIVFLGNCAYTFEYTEFFHSGAFKQALTQYMREYHGSLWSMNKYISPGSVGVATALGNYFCSPIAFNQGTFGKISAGWDKSGGTVAIKVFKNPKKSEIHSHVKLMESIGQHENILRLLECVSHFDTKVPDAYCVYTPLASTNLSDVINGYTTDAIAKSALFIDYLSGLSYLHDQKGIMHRDISAGNLAITSLSEPRGIILDLDAATTSDISTDHMKGTLPCLAPEIMALKDWDGACKQPPPYEKSIDTWALGLIMYALYTGQPFDWSFFGATTSGTVATVTPKTFTSFQDRLGKYRQNTESPEARAALSTVARMTAWKGAYRCSASYALQMLLQARSSQARGTIVLKESRKRPWEDN